MNLVQYTHNVCEFIPNAENSATHCSRVPAAIRDQLNEKAQLKCLDAAATEIRLRVDPNGKGGKATIYVHNENSVHVEVYAGDYYLWKFQAGPGEHEIPLNPNISYPWTGDFNLGEFLGNIERHRFSAGIIRICFEYNASIGLVNIEGDVSPVEQDDLPEKTLLTYGSSITQGAFAITAQNSYAPRLAYELGMDHLNLGLAGSALCEAAIADHIAERNDWDCATLEMGINMGGFSEADFEERVRYMVSRIAGPKQTRPVFCLDMFRHFADLPEHDGNKAAAFRRIVAETCSELGGPNTHFISIADVPAWHELGADVLHPSERGMESMANYLVPKLRANL